MDAILNLGMPAPLDIQVSGMNMETAHGWRRDLARKIKALPGVSDVLVPQDIDYPALQLDIDRLRAAELGLNEKEVVGNVITALTSDADDRAELLGRSRRAATIISSPSSIPRNYVKNLADLASIPVRGANSRAAHAARCVEHHQPPQSPTEVDHYQLLRVMDVYVAPRARIWGG